MNVILITIGNPLRGDDGAAHIVPSLMTIPARTLAVQQLTPEIAAELAGSDLAVFIDASADAAEVQITDPARDAAPVLSHSSSPEEILAIAKRVFGFSGQAFCCAIPASNFNAGESISEQGRNHAQAAARELDRTLVEIAPATNATETHPAAQ